MSKSVFEFQYSAQICNIYVGVGSLEYDKCDGIRRGGQDGEVLFTDIVTYHCK